jgi:Protein of unknown function (DUF964).
MDIITLAQELALAVQQDNRYIYLDSARKTNDIDEELQKQIEDFNIARVSLNMEANKPEKDTHYLDELNEKVNTLYNDIMNNESMIAYNSAKNEVDLLMKHIQAILAEAVNGGDPTKVTAPPVGCSGSCGSYNGCSN